jgi:hypothetical protein
MTGNPRDDQPPEEFTDEMLMSYADGDPELPPEQWRRITARLEHDPELVKRLEGFMFTRGPFRTPFDEVMATTPPKLIAAVRAVAEPARKPSRWTSVLDVLRAPRWRTPVWAVASVAILLAAPGGWLLSNAMHNDAQRREAQRIGALDLTLGRVMAWGPQRDGLETVASGASVEIGRDVRMKLMFTFPGLDNRWCRQFVMVYGAKLDAPGVACRGPDGHWHVLLQSIPHPAGPEGPTVAGPQADRERELFELARDRLRTADNATRAREAELIKEHWQGKP